MEPEAHDTSATIETDASIINQHHPTRKRESSKNCAYGIWTSSEDSLLLKLKEETPQKKPWTTLSKQFVNKTPQQIMNRWNKVLNPQLIKGGWTNEEDEILQKWVGEHGECGWTKVAAQLPGRIGKQCRERWFNSLKPDIKKSGWTIEEDNLIIQLQAKFGNKWATISDMIDGRTDNQIKNRWNSVLKKRINNSKMPIHLDLPPMDFESPAVLDSTSIDCSKFDIFPTEPFLEISDVFDHYMIDSIWNQYSF